MVNEGERTSGNVGLRLTYVAIARHLGISDDAARMLVRRRGWQRIQPNRQGAPTVGRHPGGRVGRRSSGGPSEHSRHVQGTSPDTEANEGDHGRRSSRMNTASWQVLSPHWRQPFALPSPHGLSRRSRAGTAERQRAEELRSQIDILNAELVVMRAEADRELAEERMRADRFSEQVDAGHRDARCRQRERRAPSSQRLQQAETDLDDRPSRHPGGPGQPPRRSGRPRPPGRRGAAYAAPGTAGGGDSVAGGRRSPAGGPASRVAAESRAARPLGTAPSGMAGTVGVVNRYRPDRREPHRTPPLFQRLRREGPRAAVRRWTRRSGNWRCTPRMRRVPPKGCGGHQMRPRRRGGLWRGSGRRGGGSENQPQAGPL